MKLRSNATLEDLPKVMKIVATFGATPENLMKIEDYIKKELSELGINRGLYLLENGSQTVGMVQIILKNADGDPELANGKDIVHVHSLQVAKNQHRKGYAEKLMTLVEQKLKADGITKLTLGVDSDNDKALNLYKKLNYSLLKKAEGRTPDNPLFYLHKSL